MELYYVYLIEKYRKSENEFFPLLEEQTDIEYYDSLPHAVQAMKEMSETTTLCRVIMACVGKAYIDNHHELVCDDIPLFFCKNYDITGNTEKISRFDYARSSRLNPVEDF